MNLYLDIETVPGPHCKDAIATMAARREEDPDKFAATSPWLCEIKRGWTTRYACGSVSAKSLMKVSITLLVRAPVEVSITVTDLQGDDHGSNPYQRTNPPTTFDSPFPLRNNCPMGDRQRMGAAGGTPYRGRRRKLASCVYGRLPGIPNRVASRISPRHVTPGVFRNMSQETRR